MSLLVNQLGEALAAMKERAEKAETQVQAVRALMPPNVSRETLRYVGIRCSDVLDALDGGDA